MIFVIDPSVSTANAWADFATLLLQVCTKKHRISMPSDLWDLVERVILNSNLYLGSLAIDQIRQNREIRSITSEDRCFLSTIRVGYSSQDDYTVSEAVELLSIPSIVVLENRHNEWPVYRFFVDIFKRDRMLKNINSQVYQAICDGRLIGGHAGGGNGTIAIQISSLPHPFPRFFHHRVTTVFDSDKVSPVDSPHNLSLINYLQLESILWHELYKRELENYFPLESYSDSGENYIGPASPSHIDWDYMDLENSFSPKLKKSNLANLIHYADRTRISNRIAHHFVSHPPVGTVSEIQEIILLFAKYI